MSQGAMGTQGEKGQGQGQGQGGHALSGGDGEKGEGLVSAVERDL